MSQGPSENYLSKYKTKTSTSSTWINNNSAASTPRNYNINQPTMNYPLNNQVNYEPSERLAHDVLNQAGPMNVYQRNNTITQMTNGGNMPTNGFGGMSSRINNDPDPVRLSRPVDAVHQKQNIRVRYLQPPEPPQHAPIVVKERQLTPPPPQPPLVVRQIAKPPPTPPPLIVRERPPTPPSVATQPTIVEKLIPPPTPPPRQVIVERIPAPEKPREIVYEKWLPYKPPGERPVIVEKGKMYERQPPPKNVIIDYEHPSVNLERQVYDEGVLRADPNSYNQNRYNGELRIVDKITDLPSSNRAFTTPQQFQPMYTANNNNMGLSSSYSTPRDMSQSQQMVNVARGPNQFMGPYNTTYRSSYQGRGFQGGSPR